MTINGRCRHAGGSLLRGSERDRRPADEARAVSAAAKHRALAALSIAFVAALSIAGAAEGAWRDRKPPSTPSNLRVTAITPSAVSLAWDRSNDNVGVAGYRIDVNGAREQTTSQLSATVSGLACGRAHTFGVTAYDRADNQSRQLWSPSRLVHAHRHRHRHRHRRATSTSTSTYSGRRAHGRVLVR